MNGKNDDPKKSHVTGSMFAGFGQLPDFTKMMRVNQEFWLTQMGLNMDLVQGMFQRDAKIEPLLYSFLNGSLSPEQRHRFALIKQQMPIPLRAMVEMFEYDPKTFVRDPSKMAMARWAFSMLPNEGELYQPQYNHQFLSEQADGTIAAIDPEKVISLFQATPANGMKKPQRFPRLIFTSSHARGDSLHDVTRITHGIEAMARDSWGGQQLSIGHLDQEVKPEQTLMLYSCETEKSAPLNGINLTERIVELEDNAALGRPDAYKSISPGAMRTARLMLACMCENYYRDDGSRLFDINDQRPLSEIFGHNEERIRLSPDAKKIAQHFQLMAYSKGGNVVSDALRLLQRDLLAVDDQDKGLVRTSEHEEDRGYLRTQYGTRSLINNIECASIAARELPFTEAQKKNGMRRVAFNNAHDPLTSEYEYESSWNDEFYLIQGVKDPLKAHDPELAMGTRHARGYILDHPEVARRMKEFFAPHYGRAAIANLFAEDGHIKIETAPSTPEAMLLKYRADIVRAMEQAGLHDPQVIENHLHIGTFVLSATEDLSNDRAALAKLGVAFESLRQGTPGLLIGQKIIDHDVPSLIEKLETQRTPSPKVKSPSSKGRAATAPDQKDKSGLTLR